MNDYKEKLEELKIVHDKLQSLLKTHWCIRSNTCMQALIKIKEANFWIEEDIKNLTEVINHRDK